MLVSELQEINLQLQSLRRETEVLAVTVCKLNFATTNKTDPEHWDLGSEELREEEIMNSNTFLFGNSIHRIISYL